MAEDPGKQTPPTDPKIQDKTSPVRPPVLEGTARTASGSKPTEPPASAKTSADSKPETTKPAATTKPRENEANTGKGTSWLVGIAGGVIGLGAAYGLAWFGLWPTPPQSPPPADPRLAQFATAIPQLQTTTGSLQGELSTLGNRLSGLETSISALPTATADAGLTEQVAALAAQVEALSNAPAPASDPVRVEGNAETIATLEAQLAALSRQSDDYAARLNDTETRIAALAGAAEKAAESQSPRIPLIFSSLESAFASGRAYEAELAALNQAWPTVAIPQSIAFGAPTGLPQPDDVTRRFNAAIPDILAGRPANADASWQDGAMDWVRGVVAMRPLGEIEGNSPEALVARLEAALARRDFIAARDGLAALPDAMRSAVGPVSADIALLAEAEAFLSGLRNAALEMENGL